MWNHYVVLEDYQIKSDIYSQNSNECNKCGRFAMEYVQWRNYKNSGGPYRQIIKVGPLLPGPVTSETLWGLSFWYLPTRKKSDMKLLRSVMNWQKKRISL